MTLADYQSTVFVKVSETEILEMSLENYLRTYWADKSAYTTEIKEVTEGVEEGMFKVIWRYKSTGSIQSIDELWSEDEAILKVLSHLYWLCQNANDDTPKAFFSREEAIG